MRSRWGEYPSWYDDEPDEPSEDERAEIERSEWEQFRFDALLDLDDAIATAEGWS